MCRLCKLRRRKKVPKNFRQFISQERRLCLYFKLFFVIFKKYNTYLKNKLK